MADGEKLKKTEEKHLIGQDSGDKKGFDSTEKNSQTTKKKHLIGQDSGDKKERKKN